MSKNKNYGTYLMRKLNASVLNTENGLNEIKDYLEYLIESFGNPGIGTHIFINCIKHFIENGQLEDKKFTDDQRLELLTHLEPSKAPSNLSERDFEALYKVFQKWLEVTPESILIVSCSKVCSLLIVFC